MAKRTSLLLLIPIALSAYTHLWNAAGFPDIFYDEGAYLRRAMNVLYFQELQESVTYYDHPYFGQILLAGLLALTGFPDSVNPSATVESIEFLYLVPKVWMGIFAVIDTLLVYKIVEYRYKDPRLGLFAALLFAVMPMSWLTRRVVLESLLLPFLLASILLAIKSSRASEGRTQQLFILMSGASLGLAVFTKMTAIVAIPVVGFLIFSSTLNRKTLALWLIPVILLPVIWPLHSISEGRFDFWMNSVLSQTQRTSDGIATILWNFWKVDPILLVTGSIGFWYLVQVKRDFFPLIWSGPFLMFFSLAGYVQYFHVIPLLPVFCISCALFIDDLVKRLQVSKVGILRPAAMVALTTFGLVMTSLLITTNMSSSQFQAATFVLWIADQDTTIVASPGYAWLYNFLLHMPYALSDYRDAIYSPLPTQSLILVSDPHFRANVNDERELQAIHNRTSSVQTFHGDIRHYDTDSYPYTSLSLTAQGETVEIRKYPSP
jgi:4-amino-4-deoxy-L-arabinose transferase-like glycosyltransferase